MANDIYSNFLSKYPDKGQPAPVGTNPSNVQADMLPRSRAIAQDKIPQQAPPQEAIPAPMDAGNNADYASVLGDQSQPALLSPEASSHSPLNSGSSPIDAIPDSPLSLLSRARLGWVRTPANQQKVLEENYGPENVQMISHDDGGAGFVIKEKDNKWYHVDPSLSWKNLGPLSYPEGTSKNMKDLIRDAPGDLAQFAGEYGMRMAGAGMGAAIGGASAGPLGALVGAGVGSMGLESADMLGRSTMPQGTIGGPDMSPKTAEDVFKQSQLAFLFGAENEGIGQGLKLTGKAAAFGLAKSLNAISDTPGGRYLASKILGTVSGQGEHMARVRIDAPMETAKFDALALDDSVNNTNVLGDKMKASIQSMYDNFMKRKGKVFGEQYNTIKNETQGLKFDPAATPKDGGVDPTTSLLSELKNNGYIKNGKPVEYQSSTDVERQLQPGEKEHLSYIMAQVHNIANKGLSGEKLTFQEMKNITGAIDNVLQVRESIQDPNLRRILSNYRRGLKNGIIDTIEEKNPELAKSYVQLDRQYGPVKDLMESLADKTGDQKVDEFMKQIVKQDGSFNSSLIDNLGGLLGEKNPTAEILRMHVAKNSTDWISGKKFLHVIPGSPMAVSRGITVYSGAKQAASNLTGVLPYLNETMKFLKDMPEGARQAMLKNPEAVNAIAKIVGTSSQAEQADKEKMLQSVGLGQ